MTRSKDSRAVAARPGPGLGLGYGELTPGEDLQEQVRTTGSFHDEYFLEGHAVVANGGLAEIWAVRPRFNDFPWQVGNYFTQVPGRAADGGVLGSISSPLNQDETMHSRLLSFLPISNAPSWPMILARRWDLGNGPHREYRSGLAA